MLQCFLGQGPGLDALRIYFQRCDRKDANGSKCVPNCLAKDVDRGVSRSSFADEHLTLYLAQVSSICGISKKLNP